MEKPEKDSSYYDEDTLSFLIRINSYENSLYDKTSMSIIKHTDYYKALQEMFEIDYEKVNKKNIDRYYRNKDINESTADKILRLKLIETKTAKEVIKNCATDECRREIISMTKNPFLCDELKYETEANCVIKHSAYSKESCYTIRQNESKNRNV